MGRIKGFYTDEQGRRRPITEGRKLRVSRKAFTAHRHKDTWVIHRNGKKIIAHARKKEYRIKGTTYETKDKGKPGRGPKVIEIEHPGLLIDLGYSTTKNSTSRHKVLAKAVKKYGASEVWRMLNVQYVYRKNARKGTKDYKDKLKFKADREWIHRTFGGPKPPRKAIERARAVNLRKGKNPYGPG